MIRVSLALLIFIYLAVFLGVIFALWIWHEWRRTVRERRSVAHRMRCTICSFEFEDATGEDLARCPRCGSLNEREPFDEL